MIASSVNQSMKSPVASAPGANAPFDLRSSVALCVRQFANRFVDMLADVLHQFIKAFLEVLAVLVGGGADPEKGFSGLRVFIRDRPEALVDQVKGHDQTDGHQNAARPHRPLSRLVRYLQSGEGKRLDIVKAGDTD